MFPLIESRSKSYTSKKSRTDNFTDVAKPRRNTASYSSLPLNMQRNGSPTRPQLHTQSWQEEYERESEDSTPVDTEDQRNRKGFFYRFHFKDHLPEYGHFDVRCDWDSAKFDTHALSEGLKFFQRLNFSRSKTGPPSEVEKATGWFKKFVADETMDIEQLAEFVTKLTPTAVADFKPMVVLQQGVINALLKRVHSFTVRRLQEEVNNLRKALKESNQRTSQHSHRQSSQQFNRQSSQHSSQQQENGHGLTSETSGSVGGREAEDGTSEQVHAETSYIKAISATVHESELVTTLRKEKCYLKSKVDSAYTKEKSLIQTLESLKAQTEQLESKHKQQLDELTEQLEAKAQETMRATLQLELASSQAYGGEGDALFCPWATFRPVLEYQWAQSILTGMATCSVPPGSQLHFPKTSLLPKGWHVCDIPGSSRIDLPNTSPTLQIVIPRLSTVTFPEATGMVKVLGGTSIVLPVSDRGVTEYEVPVSGGFIIHRGAGEPVLAHGLTVKQIHIKEITLSRKNENDLVVPKSSKPEIFQIPAGSTIIATPGDARPITLPTGCQFLVPVGSTRLLEVPGGSQVLTPATPSDHVVMVPSHSIVHLPATFPGNRKDGFAVFAPHGSRVDLPQGTQVKVIVPPESHLMAPADARGLATDCDLGPGEDLLVESGFHQTLVVVEKTQIFYPKAKPMKPKKIVRRMVDLGTEACAAGVGGMNPELAAGVLDVMDPLFAAEVLRFARPLVAARLMRKMTNPDVLMTAFRNMSTSAVGTIFSEFTPDEISRKIQPLFQRDHMLFQSCIDKMGAFVLAREMLAQPAIMIRKLVDTLDLLEPETYARLLAGAPSQRVCLVFMRMAAKNHEKASRGMEFLSQITARHCRLEKRLKNLDMRRAHLLQAVSSAPSEEDMGTALIELMDFMKREYDVACTLVRAPQGLSWTKSGLEAERNSIYDDSSSEGRLLMETLVDRECRAGDQLEILANTEDIIWGIGTPLHDADKIMDDSTTTSVSIQTGVLKHASREAMMKRETVHSGMMISVPITIQGLGRPYGALTHINKTVACGEIMGGTFPKPDRNGVPAAVECLKLLGSAIGHAFSEMQRKRDEIGKGDAYAEDVEKMLLEIEAGHEVPHFVVLKRGVDFLLHHSIEKRRNKAEEISRTQKDAVLEALRESIQGGPPPKPVRRLLLAMLVTLQTPELKPHLETIADKSKDEELWMLTRSAIILDYHHPRFILRTIKKFSQGMTLSLDVSQMKSSKDAVEALFKDVSVRRDTVMDVFEVFGIVWDWIQAVKCSNRYQLCLLSQKVA